MTLPTKTERRAIVDTHRHPWGKRMHAKMEEQGLLGPKLGFPQTNAQDFMGYREVFDLDYAMPIQREGGITLSLMTNGGEVAWLADDLLRVSTVDGPQVLERRIRGYHESLSWRVRTDGQRTRTRRGLSPRC